MKKLLKISNLCLIFFSFTTLLFAFDWPQESYDENSVISYYGQNRGGLLSSSYIFKETKAVKASEDGRILVIMNNTPDDSDFFPTALGSSVILSHSDNLVTVYGNLDKDNFGLLEESDTTAETVTAPEELSFSKNPLPDNIEKGSVFALSGNTAWQENLNGLEYQIIDFKNTSSINPKLLLPRSSTEFHLPLNGITLRNKNGIFYDVKNTKSINSGIYKIYRVRDSVAVPYKTAIFVNGIQNDSIIFNMLTQNNNKIICGTTTKYNSNDVYPDENLQLLGEVVLSPGKLNIGIEINDILNNITQSSFTITVN